MLKWSRRRRNQELKARNCPKKRLEILSSAEMKLTSMRTTDGVAKS